MERDAALATRHHQVFDTRIGEGAAHHHLVVGAARAEARQIGAAGRNQPVAGQCTFADGRHGADMVGGQLVTEYAQRTAAFDVADFGQRNLEAFKQRRLEHVSRLRVPLEQCALGFGNGVPQVFCAVEIAVFTLEVVAVGGVFHQRVDFSGCGPQVFEEHRFAVFVVADGVGVRVFQYGAGERKRDHQRRAHQEVGFQALVDARFEVAVAGENRCGDQVVFDHGVFEVLVQRSGQTHTGGATVSDDMEAELLKVGQQAGLFQIGSDDLGARRHGGFHARMRLHAALDGFLGQQASGEQHPRV